MVKIHPDTLQFFEELNLNNNREWFQANKGRWDAIRKQFLEFTQAVVDEMVKLDPSLGNLTADKCMYRIYRDLRFSTDKRPYKTHIAFFLPTGGNKKCAVPGYYLQMGQEDYGLNGGCSMGGGIFMPQPKALDAIRQEIFYNVDELKRIMNEPKYKNYFGKDFFTTKKLSRAPKGYPNDWADADLLKFKDYTTMHTMPNELIFSDEMFGYVMDVFKASVPLNLFIQKAMYDML